MGPLPCEDTILLSRGRGEGRRLQSDPQTSDTGPGARPSTSGAAAPSPSRRLRGAEGRAQWVRRNLSVFTNNDASLRREMLGDTAHLEGIVDIRVRKRVTVEIRHLSRTPRHPPDPGAERETRRGRRPPARSRRRRADPGAARWATQPAAPLSMPGATGSGPAALIQCAVPFLWAWIQHSGLWLRLRAEGAGSSVIRPISRGPAD